MLKIWKIFIAVSLCCMLLACEKEQQEIKLDRSHYEKGLQYLENGEHKSAIIELRNAVRLEPKFADAHYHLSLAYMKDLNGQKALGEMLRATSLDPENTDAALKLAGMLLLARQLDDSKKYVVRILSKDPNHPEALTIKASIALMENQFNEAEHLINKVINLRPDQGHLYRIRANISIAQGKVKEGVADLLYALTLDENDQETHWILSSYYLENKQYVLAEKQLLEMKRRYPATIRPYEGLTTLYMQTNKFNKLEENLKDGIHANSANTQLYLLLSTFYQNTGRLPQAESVLKNALPVVKEPLDIRAALADLYLTKGFSEEALHELDAVFQVNSQHRKAILTKAKMLLGQGKDNDALQLIDGLIGDDPQWGEPYFFKAMAYHHQGEKKLARQAVERAIQLSPSLPHPHILQAQLSLQDRLFTVAREQAQQALILKPDSKEAGIIIGLSYLNGYNTSQAIEKFTILSRLYQNDPAILRYLGLAHVQDNAIDKASSTFKHILSIDPGYSPALSSLVDISLSQNDLEGAYKWVRRQLEIAPDKPENHLVLSNLLMREKKYSEAISQLKQAQKIDPLNTSVLHALAKAYAFSGEERLAVVEYRKLLADAPGITSAYMELAGLLIKMNDPDGAQQLYRDLLQIRPSNTQAANNLAWLIAEDDEGDLGEAFRFALMARQKDSGNPYAWDTLGWVYYKRGDHEKAMEEIQGAVNMQPNEPVFYYHLAVIYQAKGEYFRAVELLKKCVSLDKPFAERQEAEELLRQLQ